MNKNPDGDCIIRDDSDSYICFVRDMAYVKNNLNTSIKSAVQVFSAILVITIITSIASVYDSLTFFIFIAESLLILLAAGIVIISIYLRNRFIMSRICHKFTVYNDRLEIDGNVFEINKIKSAFMTPFEYYEKRFISFEYNNKTYSYYFGKFNGFNRSQLFYKPYVQLNMLLESRGFLNQY